MRTAVPVNNPARKNVLAMRAETAKRSFARTRIQVWRLLALNVQETMKKSNHFVRPSVSFRR